MYRFSKREIVDIAKSWTAITIAFGIILFRESGAYAFIISAAAVGLGFLIHELAHKFVAQKYGLAAEFHSFDGMLVLAVAMSFFGFVFAAPGAVMISSRTNSRKMGRIAAAGPIANLALASIFLLVALMLNLSITSGLIASGIRINGWLALFNLMPVWMFDGAKIIRWSKIIWFAMLLVAGAFVFIL